jgi:hypothetical protein
VSEALSQWIKRPERETPFVSIYGQRPTCLELIYMYLVPFHDVVLRRRDKSALTTMPENSSLPRLSKKGMLALEILD